MYGLVPHCRAATLVAQLGPTQLDTLVTVDDLSVKEGTLLHKLTARALIRDYEVGMLSEDQRLHEVCVRK